MFRHVCFSLLSGSSTVRIACSKHPLAVDPRFTTQCCHSSSLALRAWALAPAKHALRDHALPPKRSARVAATRRDHRGTRVALEQALFRESTQGQRLQGARSPLVTIKWHPWGGLQSPGPLSVASEERNVSTSISNLLMSSLLCDFSISFASFRLAPTAFSPGSQGSQRSTSGRATVDRGATTCRTRNRRRHTLSQFEGPADHCLSMESIEGGALLVGAKRFPGCCLLVVGISIEWSPSCPVRAANESHHVAARSGGLVRL